MSSENCKRKDDVIILLSSNNEDNENVVLGGRTTTKYNWRGRTISAALIYLAFNLIHPSEADHQLKIPDFLHVCQRFDPDLENCIQNSINELQPHLGKGIPEMNVPPLEPLLIKQLVAAQGSGLKVTTEDLKVYGCSNFTIKKLSVDIKENKFFFTLDLPHLVLDGRYVVDGRIILIPVRGNGPLTGDIYKAKANITLVGEIVEKDEEDYMTYKSLNIKFRVGSGRLKLDNLFNGERVIGEIINTAINLNFDQFIKELTPIIEKVLADFMLESANKIVGGFPYRVLFPDH